MVLVPAGVAAWFTIRFHEIDRPFWVLGLVLFAAACLLLRRTSIAHHLERAPGGGGAWLALLVLVGFVLRVIWIDYAQTEPRSDFRAYLDLARTWALEGTYGLGGHPSNRRPPGFPFVLGLLIELGLDPIRSGQLFNVTVSASTAIPIYLWAKDWAGQAAGISGAAIFALMPSQIFDCSILASEPLFTFFVAWSSYAFLRMLLAPQKRWLLFAVLAGVIAGIGTYVRSQGIIVPLAIGIVAWARGPNSKRSAERALGEQRPDHGDMCHQAVWLGRRERLIRTTVACAVAVACLIPWAVRNQRAIGRPSLLTAGGGVSAYIGNNPRADGRHLDETDWPDRIDRYDEQAQDRIGYEKAFAWIAAHPLDFVALIPKKWAHLFKSEHDAVHWSHTSPQGERIAPISHAVTQGFYVLVLVLAVAGVWRMRGTRLPLFADPAIALLLAWYALHAFYHAQPRYHAALLPSFVVLAALSLRGPAVPEKIRVPAHPTK